MKQIKRLIFIQLIEFYTSASSHSAFARLNSEYRVMSVCVCVRVSVCVLNISGLTGKRFFCCAFRHLAVVLCSTYKLGCYGKNISHTRPRASTHTCATYSTTNNNSVAPEWKRKFICIFAWICTTWRSRVQDKILISLRPFLLFASAQRFEFQWAATIKLLDSQNVPNHFHNLSHTCCFRAVKTYT